uniref:Probable serine/threonine-protein kinase nek3 n=1 Tax=Drosophila rhopaloa TaxID=1041015 RepID=A0A6P4FFK0_DRORH
MSCQQASRFHSATATTTLAKSTATRRIATATAAATAPATATAAATAITTAAATPAVTTAATLTPVESIAGKTTSEDSDPYAFTETVAVAPPILFNAQKSRARLSDSNRGNNKRQTAATAAASIKASLVAQLNATAAAKAQASLGNTNTTNFHHVTQSQRQSALSPALQLQLPLQSQSQSQASPKRATNVCIVRPQQQQQEKTATAESCQPPAAPPPHYDHTPSLWQTPLLLDNSQKQQLLQQQYQQQQQTVAIALVSPPTSPASLPSPTLPPATAAVTAMVAPISVSPKGGLPLPPSKFHHTTLAQHLQKVECLKKKKSLPLACQNNNNSKLQNNNNVVESLNKPVMQGTNYNQTQPPPLMVFNTGTVAVPIQTPQIAAPQKHSTGNSVDDSDLNEIPVNVIFRKPPVAGGAVATGGTGATGLTGSGAQQSRPAGVKLVTPLTPPTPPEMPAPPLLAHMQPQMPTSCVPALTPSFKVMPPAALSTKVVLTAPPSSKLSIPVAPALTNSLEIAPKVVPATITSSAPALAKKTEQMSSKVAITNAAIRQAPIASNGGRRGITSTNNNRNNSITVKKSPPTSMPPPQEPISSPAIKADPAHRQRRRKPASKRSSATLSENEIFPEDSPYCLQQHWLHSGSKNQAQDTPLSQSNRREERIAVRKGVLRRQALQLLSTRSLQELPMRAAKQRLQCVQNMLIKYQDHAGQQQGIGIGNRCLVTSCKQPTLSMAAHCERHIVNNSTQQLFQPCVAWRMDGTACKAPVFDLQHTLALCKVHSHLRSGMDAARPVPKQVPVSLPVAGVATNSPTLSVPVKQQRKRKANTNPVPRPQKRGRKPATEQNANQIISQINTLPLIPSAGMQRKSSTTSLESIASNSHSSATSHSQLPYTPANVSAAVPAAQNLPQISIPPALAPLSGDFQPKQLHETLSVPKLEVDSLFKFEAEQSQQQHLDSGLHLLTNANIKAEEISQIVAQLAAASGDLPQHNNNNSSNHNNNNSVHFNNNNNMNYSNNNNNQHSFPSFNTAFGNAMGQPTNIITHNGHAAPAVLANTADLLGQDMFGICENSSAYASSEDTGLGGLSESELIGANDADDIALNGAHLLEEHDLVNVFDTLPNDAFEELFQSVQQAECEAMDRALEIADKNLKCLQQTIGGSADSAFLNDFLGDDLLADAVMHSPNTSGIDAATLFVDSSSGGGNSSSNGASDIRGLVQT